MSNETENVRKMPTYTCEKCARTFSQKSHYTAHQKKKYDCSTQTNMAVAKAIIEKEEMKEMNDKYFDISDYKLYELPNFMSYAFDLTDNSIINAMAYIEYEQSNKSYDGIIFYTNFKQKGKCSIREGNYRLCHDILILEEGDTLCLSHGINKFQFTEKDIKYFPLLFVYSMGVEILSQNPVKIISFTNANKRKVLQTKFHTNNSMIQFNIDRVGHTLNIKLPEFSEFVNNLHLIEMGEMLSESETLSMLTSSSDDEKKEYDGFSHPIVCNDNLDDVIVGRFVDVIILNEFVNVILQSRTKERIELSVNDIKYVPIYLLKDTMVSLVYKDVAVVTAITFFKDQFRTTTYDYGSFNIQDGFLKKKEPSLVNTNDKNNDSNHSA